jgi:peptidoglycan/LPS O-acetylase OafA/YrhL
MYGALYRIERPALQWLTLITLMVVLPWIAYRFIEAPMIGYGRLLAAGFGPESDCVLEAPVLAGIGSGLKPQEAERTYR